MSAELVDPFATHEPTREQLKAADMCNDISGRLLVSQQNDPPLYSQLVQKTLVELLGRAGVDPWCRWLLEQLHHRAVSGIPYGEPEEPAWSLDPDPRPYERVLSDDVEPGDLG